MTALADQSSMPVWPWQAWVILAIVVAAVGAFWWLYRYDNPLLGSDTSRLDHLDGIDKPAPPRCWSTGPRGGHSYVNRGGQWTCMRCGDRRAS